MAAVSEASQADQWEHSNGQLTTTQRTLGTEMPASMNPASLDVNQLNEIRAALALHGVIVFRAQSWTATEQRNFTVQLGDGVVAAADDRLQYTLFTDDEDPLLQGVVRFARNTHPSFGLDWHTDLSFSPTPS